MEIQVYLFEGDDFPKGTLVPKACRQQVWCLEELVRTRLGLGKNHCICVTPVFEKSEIDLMKKTRPGRK